MSDKNTFYVTTPIYYVNARPHIGHAYTTIVADVLARRHRLLGEDTFFLTGTDEHGQKIERSAAAAGIPPQQFADQVSKSFSDLWQRMGITNNDYIRTTSPKHKQGVQHLFSELYKNGFIYLSTYTGAYCVSDEAFVDAPVGTPCPDCGRLLESVTEENFFFKLSAFQKPLLDLIESNTLAITPDSRRNEVLSFLCGRVDELVIPEYIEKFPEFADKLVTQETALEWGFTEGLIRKVERGPDLQPRYYVPGALKDLSISRSSFTWGIPVPEDVQRAAGATQNHVIYVWLDALANYITALGYGSDDETLFKKFWPANLHLVGKEIIRFHCVYWPAFLLALNPAYKAPSPEAVILSEGRSAQPKDPEGANPTETANPFSTTNPNSVIPSEGPEQAKRAEGAQPKDPEGADPTTTANTFSTPTAPPQLTFDQHRTWAETMLPKAVTAHGWLLFEESKMSKSRGNIVRTETILEAFGTLCPNVLKGTGFSPSVTNATNEEGALAPEGISTDPQLSTESTDRRGTASAVPNTPPNENGALAPEAQQPTKADRDLFASDVLRYFLLREIPFGQDGSFSFDAMITRYNADLANGYGNLVSRTLTLISKTSDSVIEDCPEAHSLVFYQAPRIETPSQPERQEILSASEGQMLGWAMTVAVDAFIRHMERFALSEALAAIARAITAVDAFMTSRKPWSATDTEISQNGRRSTLYTAAESIRIITALLYPILPYTTAKVWAQLGLEPSELTTYNVQRTTLAWGGLKPGTKLGPLSPIFPRADKGLAKIMSDMENPTPADTTPSDPAAVPPTADPAAAPRTATLNEPITTLPVAGSTALTTGPAPAEHPGPSTLDPGPSSHISIDDFIKIELRVAEIKLAERIPKADKLLRLEVDLGELGTRQILSGIAEHYAPEDLIGRRIIVITNLAPRKMRGLESHGMLLAASEENGKPFLATVPEGVPIGTRLK